MAQLDLLNIPALMIPAAQIPQSSLPPVSPLPSKSNSAYRTISEVADELDVPQHVLRFWESHFPQVKPSRMRGSRRYYRPEDVAVLKTIKTLLYNKGYTIKGAKQIVKNGQEASEIMPHTRIASTAPVASSVKPAASYKTLDKQALISELRVLKSMLTSLL